MTQAKHTKAVTQELKVNTFFHLINHIPQMLGQAY